MPEYTVDWFSHHIPNWERWLGGMRSKETKLGLELGVFEGRATTWLCENIFTAPSDRLYCVDSFKGSDEHAGIDMEQVRRRFMANSSGFGERVRLIESESWGAWRNIPFNLDFAYIDADHHAAAVLEDCVRCMRHMRSGGIMILDDYLYGWPHGCPANIPKAGIDAFLSVYSDRLAIVEQCYQICLRVL